MINTVIIPQEKSQLQEKLKECERRLRLMELTDTTDATEAKRYKTNDQTRNISLRKQSQLNKLLPIT